MRGPRTGGTPPRQGTHSFFASSFANWTSSQQNSEPILTGGLPDLRQPVFRSALCHPVLCQNSAVIRKKENRPEAADYGRSNPRNQRRLDFLRSTGRLEMVSVFMGSDSATKMEISADRVW